MSTEVIDVDKKTGELIERDDKIVAAVERYRGISQVPVPEDKARMLMAPIEDSDIEIRPDGMIYLPEIKYRRRLNQCFGPGGWALMPTSKFDTRDNTIMRQYALYGNGRFISEAVGEQEYIQSNPNMSYATAAEGCKSNAIMRCCKDLGIASELWDPAFIAQWVPKFAVKVWNPKTSKFNWRRKDREPFFWEKKEKKQEAHEGSSDYDPTEQSPADQDEGYTHHEPDQPPPSEFISEPQRKRLFAIAMKSVGDKEKVKSLLAEMKIEHTSQIKKVDYEDICAFFENYQSRG